MAIAQRGGTGRDGGFPLLGPLVAALLTVAGLVAGADYLLSPALLRGVREASVLAGADDDQTHVVYASVNWPAPTRPALVLLGASALREALPSPDEMERRLRARFGETVPFLLLASSGQSITESLVLLDWLALPPGSIAVVHLTPARLAFRLEDAEREAREPQLPLVPYDEARAVVEEQGGSAAARPAVLRNRAWLARLVRSRVRAAASPCLGVPGGQVPRWRCLAGAPARWRVAAQPYRQYKYAPAPLPPAVKDSLVRLAGYQAAALASRSPRFSEAVLERILRLSAARGIRVLFLRLPGDPMAQLTDAAGDARFRQAAALATASGGRYIDVARDPGFASRDFYDLHHLLPDGRERFARMLLDSIAVLRPVRRPAGLPRG